MVLSCRKLKIAFVSEKKSVCTYFGKLTTSHSISSNKVKFWLKLITENVHISIFLWIQFECMNEWIGKVRAHAKQCLLCRPWPYRPIGKLQVLWDNLKSKVCQAQPSLTRPVPINWLQLAVAVPTGPSPSGVSYTERRSVSNQGSQHRESNVIPAEPRKGRK